MKIYIRKRWCAALVAVVMLASAIICVPLGALRSEASDGVGLRIGGKSVSIGQKLIDSTTYVPFEKFVTALSGNITVKRAASGKSCSAVYGKVTVSADSNEITVSAAGRYFTCGKENLMIGGVLYVPVRPLSSAFGATVTWDASTKSASIGKIHTIASADSFYNSGDLYWLARIISAESCGQSLVGQIAVGSVIMNRVRSKDYPNSIYGVVFDRKYGVQFTPTSNGTVYNTPTENSIIAAKITLEGYRVSDDIMYFMNRKLAVSKWIEKNCRYAFTIGDHSFYC